MKLVKIQDKHVISEKNLPLWKRKLYDGNACHIYILYDEKTKKGGVKHQLLATSHYYDPDKVSSIKKKNAILMKFKGLKEPTTVTNVRYSKDLKGSSFSPFYKNMETICELSDYQEKRIRRELLFLKKGKQKIIKSKKNNKKPTRP